MRKRQNLSYNNIKKNSEQIIKSDIFEFVLSIQSITEHTAYHLNSIFMNNIATIVQNYLKMLYLSSSLLKKMRSFCVFVFTSIIHCIRSVYPFSEVVKWTFLCCCYHSKATNIKLNK